MAKILDGSGIAGQLRSALKARLLQLALVEEQAPGLAVILVGDDPASQIYVRNKAQACQEVGMRSYLYRLPTTVTEADLLARIDQLNHDSRVDGILVQLPLPRQIDSSKVIDQINPKKDVDGFHPYNVGRLSIGYPALRSCTAQAVMGLLNTLERPLVGLHAVILGTSNIVGKPLAMELVNAQLTVTLCSKMTPRLELITQQADILVVAVGVAGLVKGSWVKPGAIVIDVGINRLPDGSLVGDVDFTEVSKVAEWITPVPGGVGPMTIATVLENTLQAAQLCRTN